MKIDGNYAYIYLSKNVTGSSQKRERNELKMDLGLKVSEESADYVLQKTADLESLRNQGYHRNSAKAFIYSGRV